MALLLNLLSLERFGAARLVQMPFSADAAGAYHRALFPSRRTVARPTLDLLVFPGIRYWPLPPKWLQHRKRISRNRGANISAFETPWSSYRLASSSSARSQILPSGASVLHPPTHTSLWMVRGCLPNSLRQKRCDRGNAPNVENSSTVVGVHKISSAHIGIGGFCPDSVPPADCHDTPNCRYKMGHRARRPSVTPRHSPPKKVRDFQRRKRP